VQALEEGRIKNIGRTHNAAQGLEAIKMCKDAGFGRISADLLLGVPGQRMERILDDAVCLVGAGAEHLSIYMLDLDKQCPMKAKLDDGLLKLPPDGLIAETYQKLQESLPQIGICPYEICNYSLPGCRSIHNTRYWQRRPYLGVGPGAASNIDNLRWKENENIIEWANGLGKPEIQCLTPIESLAEIPLLALRMCDGVDWRALRRLAESQGLGWQVQKWEAELEPFVGRGFVQWDGDNMRYWQRRPYLGVGPGAASNIGNLRWKENENIIEWVNGLGKFDIQCLTPIESLAEIPLLALRMCDGADWRALRRLAESQGLGRQVQKWETELEPFIGHGFMQWDGDNMRLTHKGMMVSNQIFQVFV
jgi:coproporphyrinogen III oxidase-like Fe-S oxidoreductase